MLHRDLFVRGLEGPEEDTMTGMEEIEIIIDRKGNVKVEAHGFSGPSCRDATQALEDALGARGPTEDKPEMFDGEGASAQVRA